MAKYITENTKSKWDDRKRNTETGKLATKLQGCANYLVFKRYLTVDEDPTPRSEFLQEAFALSVLCDAPWGKISSGL